MATRMQQRRGTAAQWTASDPILNIGEIGFESDNNKFKIGDGVNHWDDLPYFLDEDTISTSMGGYLEDTLLGANNGVAQLNSTGKLVSTQIPNVDEITQDAINTALVAGIGLDKTYDDAGNTITLDIDSTVATLTGTQTLTNKTLTAPVISTITSGAATLTLPTTTGTVALTTDLPSGMVTQTATQTLTNKTLTSPIIATVVNGAATLTLPSSTGTIALTSDITASALANDSITAVKLAGDAVTSSKIQNGAVETAKIADSAVTSAKIANDTIVDADINSAAAIAQSKISGLTTDLAAKAPLASPTFTGTVSGVTATHVGLANVDNTTDANKPISTATQTALDLKAPLASPALTGTPTAPTAAANTNTTQVATTAFVGTAVADLVASAPSTLNTLNELATALGNDAAFSTTLTNSIALKAPLASPTFTGAVNFTGATVTGISSYNAPTLGSTSIASGATVTTVAGLTLTAPTLTGTVTASGDINLSAANGPGSLIDELALILMGAL